MNKEYIEREAVLYQLNKMMYEDNQPRAFKRAIKVVEGHAAADVKPVVHGKWHNCYELMDGTFVGTCSACGKIKKSLYPVMDNYCGECGAIMDADMRGNVKCPKEE